MALLQTPTLTAYIVTNGMQYPGWESVEVSRTFGENVSYMKFTAAEDELIAASYSVVPGDPAQGYLAGVKVIDGEVITRQVVFDKTTHSVEIIVASSTQSAMVGTVQNNPGQYKGQTLQQIASTALAAVGLNLRMTGDLSGADLPFLRVSEHIGERCVDFVRRLAMWRNLHMTDDSNGNFVLTRAQAAVAASGATLVEGQNIESARMLENRQFLSNRVATTTQFMGNDQTNGTASSQVYAGVTNPNFQGKPRPILFLGEMPATQAETALRTNHSVQLMNLDLLEAVITVPGWLMDDGTLWILHVGDMAAMPVTIYSPMLFPSEPNGTATLLLKGAKHLQDNVGGTRTELTLCLESGLGVNRIQTDASLGAMPSGPVQAAGG